MIHWRVILACYQWAFSRSTTSWMSELWLAYSLRCLSISIHCTPTASSPETATLLSQSQHVKKTQSLSRKHLRIITGLLTGHVALNRHLTVMKIRTDLLCPICGEEEETAYHLLGRCSAMMMARYSIFGSYLMDIIELHQVQPHTLFRFANASKRFI